MDPSIAVRTEPPRAATATHRRRNPLWALKLRLQFTGWLQYIANGLLALLFLLAAGLGALIAAVTGLTGAAPLLVVGLPAAIGLALLAILAFDLVTIRLGVHPAEPLPHTLEGLDAFDLMRARRSCRSFQRRSLRDRDRGAVLASVRAHTRLERRIGSRPIRLEYVPARLTVWPVVGAHEFLVAIAPGDYDRTAVIDVGRSLQKVVLDATRLGLATCWIGPGADHRSILRALGDRFDPQRDQIVCVAAVGYRSRYLPFITRLMALWMHRRLPLRRLIFADPAFTEPLDVGAEPFAGFGRCYEVCQWSPSSYNGQQARATAVTAQVGGAVRLERLDFAAATASRYYAPIAVGIWLANWETGCEALGIAGHPEVLPPEARAMPGASTLPRYDVSWIPDRPVAA